MPMIDFQQVKADFPILDVATRLGLQLKKAGNTFRCQCPSGEGNERGMVITPDKGVFYSFPKQTGGDVIKLVSFVQGIDAKSAAAWITGETSVPEKKRGDKAPEVRESSATQVPTAKPSEGFKPLDYLVSDHEALVAIGFPTDFATELGIGYAPRGVMRGYVALPVRDCNGRLRGYVGIQEAKLPSSWHE